MARNLEMLVLAAQARGRYAPEAKLVYECLDIHRMLLSNGPGGALLRLLESRLWRDVDMLLTSSPAFLRQLFCARVASPRQSGWRRTSFCSSTPMSSTVPPPQRPAGPPWRIGWFGMIRCRRSLDLLSALARAADGAIEVIIRGRPSGATFPDFDAVVANRPHVHYAGPYSNPSDLPRIYGDVHFTWAIDYYESGQNSAWLLPNRLYEGPFYGAVPIGLSGTETRTWLNQHKVGVVLDDPVEAQLNGLFRSINQTDYAKLAAAVAALPRAALVYDRTDCRDLVEALCQPSAEAAKTCRSDSAPGATLLPKPNRLGACQ